jgi:anti-sigma factor RsiW
MNCTESRKLIEAFTDGELDLVRHTELEEHVRTCEACAALAKASLERRSAVVSSANRFKATQSLQSSVRAALLANGMKTTAVPIRAPRRQPFLYYAGLAASVAVALGLGFGYGVSRTRSGIVANEAVANHLRSLQANHLMDVVSTDQHTVKPWFAGKLDFSPPVVDLADIGFPLVGGRLERIGGHPAAALVFRRKLHVINVYVWPQSDGSAAPSSVRRMNGFGVVGWSEAGLNFAAVSEIPEEDLKGFVSEMRRRTASAAPE